MPRRKPEAAIVVTVADQTVKLCATLPLRIAIAGIAGVSLHDVAIQSGDKDEARGVELSAIDHLIRRYCNDRSRERRYR